MNPREKFKADFKAAAKLPAQHKVDAVANALIAYIEAITPKPITKIDFTLSLEDQERLRKALSDGDIDVKKTKGGLFP